MVQVPPLEGEGGSGVGPAAAPSVERGASGPSAAAAIGEPGRRARVATALAVAAAASLGAAAYFGLVARADWRERNDHCPAGACDAEAVQAWQRARTFA